MQSLQGKTALITGAGKGLGRAMALALAAEGVHLVLLARTATDLEKVAAEAKAINATINISWHPVNVGSYAEVKSAIDKVAATNTGIDILINNAGILKTGGFLQLPVAEWEEAIQVNLLGAYYVAHEVLPLMLQQGRGDIINVASTAGLKGAANMSVYGASKAALINMSESLMQEFRKSNIRVTTVNPSTIATEMTMKAKFTDGNEEKVLQPEDLAYVIVHNLKLPQRAFIKEFGLWSTNP
ncbi:3-ketoacyl-ACP reductase [Paraflavitalea pollutisoli]|uniref:3-ketoacyl-ACP reductase n=1 Tax=Paraflavitalea pollutisoli TaxID=3034143 RepID=UPI0023ED10F4|nr:3-ketoacyl-ACP reductase [Paraflavitalea sp. H1-2-19X]